MNDRDMNYDAIVSFHGHDCPGLAIGYRMATAALEQLQSFRAEDEELVAIVENDACGVDALQCVTGCTFGKGNLLFHDYGKQVYTLYSRKTRKGVRVVYHGNEITPAMRRSKSELIGYILSAPAQGILTASEVRIDEPEPARIRQSIPCSLCGEEVKETRIQERGGQKVCIPCGKKAGKREDVE